MSYTYYPPRSRYGGRKRLGRGGRAKRWYPPLKRRRGNRNFVGRTMGALAQSESKYFDSFLDDTVITAASASWAGTEADPATALTLFLPTEGSDIDNRIGRRVSVYKLAIRGIITMDGLSDQADALAMPSFRIIVYLDTQTNGAQVQGETLMQGPGAATSELVHCTFQNTNSFGRFRVLRDITIRPKLTERINDAVATGSIVQDDCPFKMTINFKKPIVFKFNGLNAGTIGDIVDNSFHLIIHKSVNNGVHDLSYQARTYYKDL